MPALHPHFTFKPVFAETVQRFRPATASESDTESAQPATGNRQPATGNQQSAIGNRQSAIVNGYFRAIGLSPDTPLADS